MTLPPRVRKPKRQSDGRVRSPKHLRWVRSHHCCVPACSNTQIEAAHVRTAANAGTGLKPGDQVTLSLCGTHHRAQHDMGAVSFAEKYGVDLMKLAREFALASPDPAVRAAAREDHLYD